MIPQHSETYVIRAYAVDLQKEIHVPTFVQLMHETAMQHVLQLKLSVWDLEPMQLAWVLTRIKVNIYKLPRLNEKIKVVTNPSAFEKIRTYRDYRVYDEEGTLLADAVSEWFLMNTQTRRLARVPQEIKSTIEEVIDQISEFLPRENEKLPAFQNGQYHRNYNVAYHDLDFNEHLNNIYYAKWVLDALPGAYLKEHQLKSLDLIYKLEAKLDDLVLSEASSLDEHQFQHRLIMGGKEIAQAKTVWI